jgi:RNA 2',3'-cyclic 3'-phosphodiesterase
MPGDGPKPKKVRLFVALELPADVRAAIAVWGAENLSDPMLRAVPEESLHLTLVFLGGVLPEEVEPAAAAVREGEGSPAPLMELLDPVGKPSRGRAGIWMLPVLSAGAEQLQAEVSGRLVAAGLYKPEGRPFWPHVTVARVRSERPGSRRPAVVERPPGELSGPLYDPFLGVRLTLYRSELQSAGARYVPLAQVELPG